MSVIPDAAPQACYQKAAKNTALENRVSSVIFVSICIKIPGLKNKVISRSLLRIMRRLTKSGGSQTRNLISIMTYIVPCRDGRVFETHEAREISVRF